MAKILKPYTIIPADLYVKRDADRQLRTIIHDMGRPGYVLVSRQMGKTNLLLNAKRELQDENSVFVYSDLSSPFNSASSCFQNIIDLTVETSGDRFSSVYKSILEKRKESNDIPAHKQHVNELRLLLKSFSGKIVIILDEIDALTKINYSDQIFSQIRSIYFTRANFPELERLTYILSGVVEPSEIIKDPKISPFNIGQKIFLNDFSKQEYESFLELSKLNIASDIKDRIYYWTNGNPRMTWDICSEIENLIEVYSEITLDLIDKTIFDLYLKSFDRPPVDNIREIVKNDYELRKAIAELYNANEVNISQEVKNKLYLAGIINYEDTAVVIKNEIIRQSLSVEWLKLIEEEEKGLIGIGLDEYKKDNFLEALVALEKYLLINEFPDTGDRSHYYYIMSNCALQLSQFEKALTYIKVRPFEKESEPIWYYKALNQKAVILNFLEREEESFLCLKEIISDWRKDGTFLKAVINIGIAYFNSKLDKYKDIAKTIFEDIINEKGFENAKFKQEELSEIKCSAFHNLGLLYQQSGDNINAVNNYKSALLFANTHSQTSITLKLVALLSDVAEIKLLIEKAINNIVENNLELKQTAFDVPIGLTDENFKDLVIITFLRFKDSTFSSIKPLLRLLGEKPLSNILLDLAIYAVSNSKWDEGVLILSDIYDNFSNEEYSASEKLKYRVLKYLAFVTEATTTVKYHIEYLEHFKTERLESIDYLDMQISSSLLYTLYADKKYPQALDYINLFHSLREFVDESILINYLVIYNIALQIYAMTLDNVKSIEMANIIMEIIDNDAIKSQKSNLLGESGFNIIKANAEQILFPDRRRNIPISIGKTYGRNDIIKVRYNDGSIVENKYKRLKVDIENRECIILE
jgi:hypothetical protein